MENSAHMSPAPATTGKVIHRAFRYDILMWILSLGRERAFREKTIDLAGLRPGESVLDAGCGTGTLAIAAKRRVGAAGRVYGIDASPEMIARASKKAKKAGVEVAFETAVAEALPLPDSSVDAVMCTVMLHHLPDEVRRQFFGEIRRVLKPGGRLLAVDFGGEAHQRHGFGFGFRMHGHEHFDLREVIPVLNESGLNAVDSGAIGFRGLQFIRAVTPAAA